MKILYLTTSFESLTLTFVAREINALRALGTEISLLGLRRGANFTAAEPECDISGCLHLYPVSGPKMLVATLGCAISRPRRFFRAVRAALVSTLDGPRVKLKLLYQLAAAMTKVAAVEAAGITHIHAHLASPPGNVAMFLGLLTGIPYSFTGHAADLYRAPEALDVKLELAAGAVAISEYNLAHYRRLHPGLRRAEVIHCGVDPDRFAFRRREACGDPLRILAVGRAAEKKGFVHLLEALALLDREGMAWTGHLVGDGPLLADLRRRAAELGLDRLELTGALQQPRIRELLDRADVFVLPCVQAADGDIDGIPVALMEAMACGCPVISTRVSGIPELVVDGETGLLADPADPAGLADALSRIANEPELVAALSVAGREHVASAFNQRTEAHRLLDFFKAMHQDRIKE